MSALNHKHKHHSHSHFLLVIFPFEILHLIPVTVVFFNYWRKFTSTKCVHLSEIFQHHEKSKATITERNAPTSWWHYSIKGETKAISIWCACRSTNCRILPCVFFSFHSPFALVFIKIRWNENHFLIYNFVVDSLVWVLWKFDAVMLLDLCLAQNLRVAAIYCVTLCTLWNILWESVCVR